MLVKAGGPETAVKIYRNAQHTPEYATWAYRDVLEGRIRNATQNTAAFREDNPAPGAPTVMVRSRFACVGCHQR
jgi:hypothetical protein